MEILRLGNRYEKIMQGHAKKKWSCGFQPARHQIGFYNHKRRLEACKLQIYNDIKNVLF